MTTLMSSTNAALPKISYVKSIDVYLGTCFVMVFASLLGKSQGSEVIIGIVDNLGRNILVFLVLKCLHILKAFLGVKDKYCADEDCEAFFWLCQITILVLF